MSNTGLYASIYREIHNWADLIDKVICAIATNQSKPDDADRQHLANLLEQLDAPGDRTLPVQHLRALLYDQHIKWSEIANALRMGTPPAPAIERLEKVARTLEHRRVGVLERLRTTDVQ